MSMELIVNPRAGNGRALRCYQTLRRHRAVLEHNPCLILSSPADTGPRLQHVVQRNPERVIVIGGDGTVRMVAAALQGTGIPLGLVPGGSSNDWARTCDLPDQPLAAFDLAFDGKASPLDVGVLSGESSGVFVNVSGAGFDALVVQTVRDNTLIRHLPGSRLPWLTGALRSLYQFRFDNVKLTIDGVRREVEGCGMVLVANGRYFGGGLPIAPSADPADGRFDVIWTKGIRRRDIPPLLLRLLNGGHLEDRRIVSARGGEIELTITSRGRSWPVESDGERAGKTPLQWSMNQGALSFVTGPGVP